MEETEFKLLNRLYQDAEIGMMSVDKVLKKVKDSALKNLLVKQYDMYDKFKDKCDTLAVNNDFDVKENSAFKKFKQTAMIYMSLWMDKSPRHIVEMMITGTVMGIVDTIKNRADTQTKNEQLAELIAEFQKIQEDFYEKLKKQLSKV